MQINLIVYASDRACRQRLLEAIHHQMAHCALSLYTDIDTLQTSLRNFISGTTWAVLVAKDRPELDEIIDLSDFMFNTRIILILYDEDMETLATGHTLYPRFVSFVGSDFKDVRSVLEKVIHNNQVLPN